MHWQNLVELNYYIHYIKIFPKSSMNTQKKFIYDPVKEANKQCHLLELYNILPTLRKDIRDHLEHFNHTQEDIIYLILAIMDLCQFRVGHTKYKNSTGISTLKRGQLNSCPSSTTSCSSIVFNGKRQVVNHCEILSEKINDMLMSLSDYKDDDDFLFTYTDLYGNQQRVTADHINELLHRYGDITTKMFRTWKANYYFIKNIKSLPIPTSRSGIKKNISSAVTITAEKLYHTKAICRRSYIDSRIVKLYESSPSSFVETLQSSRQATNPFLLSGEEDVIRLLEPMC